MPAQLSISEDRLRAILSIPAGLRLDMTQVKQMVVERHICVGLRSNLLTEATHPSEQERSLVIALGVPSQSRYYYKRRPECKEDGCEVRKGQVIADLVFDEEREVHQGMGVDGSPLAVDEQAVCDIIIGSGLEKRKEGLLANREGVLQIADGLIWRIVDDPRGKPKRDAVLFLADDYHSAWLRLEPGEFIPMDVLHHLCIEKGISFGLNPDALTQAAQGVASAQTIEVARGVYAENGTDGWIEYLINDKVAYEVREDGTLDFRAAHPIQEVSEGQVVAQIHPPTPGQLGMDIRGKRLDPKPGRSLDPARFCGDGVIAQPAQENEAVAIAAARKGVYNRLVSGKVQVREQVLIDGDVDMKTGNVESEYPIRITGDITAGFIVKSQCDIVVDGSIEDARVSAQGNLQVKGGILPGENRVKAHGDIQCRFIEGRHIKARSVLTQSSIRHCSIYATGEVVAQEILGGHIVAALDITAKQVGDEQEQRTILQAGVDPMQQAELDEVLERKKVLQPEVARMEGALRSAINHANGLARKVSHMATQNTDPKHMKRVTQEGRDALAESRRIHTELDTLIAELAEVEKVIEGYEGASSKSAKCCIRISSAVYPGVEIRIGRHARKRMVGGCGASIFRIEEGVIVH